MSRSRRSRSWLFDAIESTAILWLKVFMQTQTKTMQRMVGIGNRATETQYRASEQKCRWIEKCSSPAEVQTSNKKQKYKSSTSHLAWTWKSASMWPRFTCIYETWQNNNRALFITMLHFSTWKSSVHNSPWNDDLSKFSSTNLIEVSLTTNSNQLPYICRPYFPYIFCRRTSSTMNISNKNYNNNNKSPYLINWIRSRSLFRENHIVAV